MNVIVVGCGRVGSELACGLQQRGHHVSVIDQDMAAFHNLPAEFRGRTVQGDVLSRDTLLRAGIEHADALAAVTPSDTINAVVAHTARVAFGVANVVVRDYDPHKRALHEAFGLQLISPSVWGAQRIEEMLSSGALRTVFSAGNGEVEIYEFTVPERWAGRTLQSLAAGAECRSVALTRAGRAMLPTPDTRVAAGDVVHVGATLTGIEALRLQLTTGGEA